jgi:2-polyprenyl-3-methyl-5-hydroxy-6-metoxy-1,4-benzoquinol methylase
VSTQEQFWRDYYVEVVEKGNPWLDYSNERVQAQTFALALEAAGPVRSKQCIDIGCGWGDFCRTLSALQASTVTGVDIVPELVAQHTQRHPEIRWLCGSLQSRDLIDQLVTYDVAFLLEILQLVPLAETLRVTWDHLLPGGRIVAMVPNANCPIVSRTRERLGSYAPPTLAQIDAAVSSLPEFQQLIYRGLSFAGDQTVVPYDVSPWKVSGGWSHEPNRIQFVALKRDAPHVPSNPVVTA